VFSDFFAFDRLTLIVSGERIFLRHTLILPHLGIKEAGLWPKILRRWRDRSNQHITLLNPFFFDRTQHPPQRIERIISKFAKNGLAGI
jgi:hypothetical protein